MRNIKEFYNSFPIVNVPEGENQTLETIIEEFKSKGLEKIIYQPKWGWDLTHPKYKDSHIPAFKLIMKDKSENTIIGYITRTNYLGSQKVTQKFIYKHFCKGSFCNGLYNIDKSTGLGDDLEEISFSDEVIDDTPVEVFKYSLNAGNLTEDQANKIGEFLSNLSVDFSITTQYE